MRLIQLSIIFCTLSLTACANLNTVHRNLDLGDATAKAVAIDGYQLPIFSMRATGHADGNLFDENGNRSVFVVCPNPPVEAITASNISAAVTNAFKGAASAGVAQSPGVSDNLQAVVASAMAAASIGLRTNSTTLLSYNSTANCLAYMGGATRDRKFMELARRNQGITLAILAIEQLTGVAQAGQATAGAGGSAGTGAVNTQAVQANLDNARKDKDLAQTILVTKEEDAKQAQKVVQDKIAILAKSRNDAAALRTPKVSPAPTPDEIKDADAAVTNALKDVENARNIVSMKDIAVYSARLDVARTSDLVLNAQTALELAESAVRAQSSGYASVGIGLGPRISATGEVANAVVEIIKVTMESIGNGEGCASVFDDFVSTQSANSTKYTMSPGYDLLTSCLDKEAIKTQQALESLPKERQKSLQLF